MKLTRDEAVRALTALGATGAYDAGKIVYATRYVKLTGIVPEWLEAAKPRTWWVCVGGERVEQVEAMSEADAVNRVRWRLYGKTPERRCPAFEAVCPFDIVMAAVGGSRAEEERHAVRDLFGNRIGRSDILGRIKKMARAN